MRAMPRETPRVLTNPARSFFWAGVWVVIGALGSFLFFAAGGFPLFASTTSYTGIKGLGFIFSIPVIGLFVAVTLVLGGIRRGEPYRSQQATPEGIARQAEQDAAAAGKSYVVLLVFGILLGVVWVFVTLFVVV